MAVRTIVLTSSGQLPCWSGCWYGWPVAEPGSSLDYSLDFTAPLAGTDALASITLEVSPSGAGEVVASNLTVTGPIVTVTLTDPFPGRSYLVNVAATGISGRVWQVTPNLLTSPVLGIYPPIDPPSAGFGTPLTWEVPASGGLLVNGIALMLISTTGWQTNTANLAAGGVWANGYFVNAVVGATPNPEAPAVFFGVITALEFQLLGASNLPITDPHVLNQIWLNGVQVCVSAG